MKSTSETDHKNYTFNTESAELHRLVETLGQTNGSRAIELLQEILKQESIGKETITHIQNDVTKDAMGEEEEILPPSYQVIDESTRVTVERINPNKEEYALDWKDLNLSPAIMKGIYAKGFTRPSRIQQIALPLLINSDECMIAQAQSGSGKTATFALCILSKIDGSSNHPQTLCVCPTRELATQNLHVIQELGIFTGFSTYLCVPQCSNYVPCQIIVATPGKITDVLKKRLFPTQYLKLLVLDEADELIDPRNNMGTQVQRIRRAFDQQLQILLFSATYADDMRQFANQLIPRANRIQVHKENLALSCIQQYYAICQDEPSKLRALCELYGSMMIGQSIIFVNSRKTAFQVALAMQKEGHAITLICGTQVSGAEQLNPDLRDKIMAEFRNGETKVLVCTDLLSRGIDVPQVTLVINYDLPYFFSEQRTQERKINTETYLHRIGRTGRFGLAGIAINLIFTHEIYAINHLASFYQCQINPLDIEPENIEIMIKNLRQ